MVERKIIPIKDLTLDRYSSRRHEWTDDVSDQELLASIRGLGLIQDVIVRPTEDKKKPYSIIAGYRRYQAMVKAKEKEVPCKVLELDDLETLKTSIGENLGRKDLSAAELMDSVNIWYHMIENTDNIKEAAIYDKEAISEISRVIYGRVSDASHKLVVQQLRISKLPKSLKILLKKPEERTESESLILKEAGIDPSYSVEFKLLDRLGAIARKLGIEKKETEKEAETQILRMISELKIDEKSLDLQIEILNNFSKELDEKPYSIALAEIKKTAGFSIKESISVNLVIPAKYLTWHKRIMEEIHAKSNVEAVRRVYVDYLEREAKRRGWI